MKKKNQVLKCLTAFCCLLLLFGSIFFAANKQQATEQAYAAEDGVTDFVSRLYTVILGREADENGLAEWTGYLEDGTFTGAQVAAGFIMSEEFLGKEMENEEFVQILYQAFFGREADATGLQTWVDFLDQGYRKSYIFAGFANSGEFGTLCDGYGVEGGSVTVTISEQQPNLSDEEYNIWLFVERLYTEVLGRTPDMNGIKEWVDYLQAGTFTGAEVSEGFIMSAEFQNKDMSNEEYVQILYKAFFGREADPSGLETWVTALETEFTKEYVFAGFANSTEFGTLCETYGIVQGEVAVPEVTPTPETPAECFEWSKKADGTVEITGLLDETLTEVVVPAKIDGMAVTSIGASAFKGKTNVVSVVLPKSITCIEDAAFSGCSNLTTIELPKSVTELGYDVFLNCTKLTRPFTWFIKADGTVEISDVSVSSLTTAEIPKKIVGRAVTSIGAYAFENERSLTSVTIPEGITSIGDGAFSGCSNLTTIELPDSVTELGYDVFLNCTKLMRPFSWFIKEDGTVEVSGVSASTITKAEVPAEIAGRPVTSIGDSAFAYKNSLESVVLPEGVTNIGKHAFSGCGSLTNIVLPEGIKSISEHAFSDCSSLTSIELPKGVTSIGNRAFMSCSSLKSIVLPEGVINISDWAFYACSSLVSIELPDSVTSIGSYTFLACTSLMTPFEWTLQDDGTIEISDVSNESITEVVVPAKIVGRAVTSIGSGAFRDCSSLTSVELPEGITSIDDYAFSGCSSLTSIGLPKGITSIGARAFYGCSSLTSIELPEGITSIGARVFEDCGSLTSIELPEGITSIDDYAFSGCSSLTSIGLSEGITSIGECAFYGCGSLASIELPDSVTNIAYSAFYYCTSLMTPFVWDFKTDGTIQITGFRDTTVAEIIVPEKIVGRTVTSIGESAFRECSNATVIVLPKGITNIGERAFEDCSRLTGIELPEGITSIGKRVFYDCSSLTSIELPEGITSIGNYAFYGCSSLSSIFVTPGTYAETWVKENYPAKIQYK